MSKFTKMLTVLLAVSALAVSATPAMGQVTVNWDGGGVTDNWSDNGKTDGDGWGNWDGNPATADTLQFPVTEWGNSTVDLDTSAWNIGTLALRGNGTLKIPSGKTLKVNSSFNMGSRGLWRTRRIGNPTVRVTGGSLITRQVAWRRGLFEFSGGSWTGGRCYAGPEIHVIGSGASSLSPSKFHCEPKDRVWFTLDDKGVTPITPTSGDPFNAPQHKGAGLKVDGIQSYIDAGKLAGDVIPLVTCGSANSDIIKIFPSELWDYDHSLATLIVDADGARLQILGSTPNKKPKTEAQKAAAKAKQLAQAKKRFAKRDKNKNGKLSAAELKGNARNYPAKRVAKLIKAKDKDGDGALTFKELTARPKKKKPANTAPRN